MQFYTLLVLLAPFIKSQSSVQAESSVSSVETAQPSAASDPCISNCKADDISCLATCGKVPNPNVGDVEKSTSCVAECNSKFNSSSSALERVECYTQCTNNFAKSGHTDSDKSSNNENISKGSNSKLSVSGSKSSKASGSVEAESSSTLVSPLIFGTIAIIAGISY